jgi:glycosyltransferase involved in cell wall biosynthesis
MNEANPALVVVIPCYNCGAAVTEVVKGVREYTENILIVNDGSCDDSAEHIRPLEAEVLSWERNQGKGRALLAGFEYWLDRADWETLVTLDSDGQHRPEDLTGFLDVYRAARPDVIIGRRDFSHTRVPPHRRWSNRLSSALIATLTGVPVRDLQCGYRMFRRSALETLLPYCQTSSYAIETEMALLAHRLGLKLAEAEIQCIYTEESSARSAWRPLRDSWNIAKVVSRMLAQRIPR